MSNSCDDVIDLTDSFTLVDHNDLQNVIIDLVTDQDDSIIDATTPSGQRHSESSSSMLNNYNSLLGSIGTASGVARKRVKQKISLIPVITNKTRQTTMNTTTMDSSKFGECPICRDELGKNPLVSTKCGHVYCLKCLESSLKVEKKCPCCRCILKGNKAYHPLYLP